MIGKIIHGVKVTNRGSFSSDAPELKEGYSVNIMPPSKPKSEEPSKNTPRKPQ